MIRIMADMMINHDTHHGGHDDHHGGQDIMT
jgi:hypothetical protein